MPLNVPTPVLSQDGRTDATLKAEQPITLNCGRVTFPDGSPLGSAAALAVGLPALPQRRRRKHDCLG